MCIRDRCTVLSKYPVKLAKNSGQPVNILFRRVLLSDLCVKPIVCLLYTSCFFRQLQLVQFFNQIMPVIFLTFYGRVKPVTVKVLCLSLIHISLRCAD